MRYMCVQGQASRTLFRPRKFGCRLKTAAKRRGGAGLGRLIELNQYVCFAVKKKRILLSNRPVISRY